MPCTLALSLFRLFSFTTVKRSTEMDLGDLDVSLYHRLRKFIVIYRSLVPRLSNSAALGVLHVSHFVAVNVHSLYAIPFHPLFLYVTGA